MSLSVYYRQYTPAKAKAKKKELAFHKEKINKSYTSGRTLYILIS